MSRIALKKGDIVSSQNCQYVIQSVIGDGATGIVYDAFYYDDIKQKHNIRLKECYPYAASIKRENGLLFWERPEEREEFTNKFIDSYIKLMKRQDSNFIVHAFNLFESNGTYYILMDSNDGYTFDKDESDNLYDILKTIKLLAYVVGEYHKNGYLHLDIKPNNFLVYPRPSEHIVLFDVDSITSIKDINNGIVKCTSYSKGWAAPEQMQGKTNKLCPATDIYSIGAILFEKITGRAVNNDDLGLFADWSFDGVLFDNVNPRIKRLLREIFHKTLCANIKRRYSSCDELIQNLSKAIECVREGAPFIISDYVVSKKNFIGRDKELQDISVAFKKNRVVFLHGVGGIGKSELAKKYSELHKQEYDAVLFCSYDNDLKAIYNDIAIQNCDVSGDERNKVLKKVLNEEKILLIIDNFDVEIDGDDYLNDFLCLNADILFTSRTDFSFLSRNKVVQIDIANLDKTSVIRLFEKESGIFFSNDEKGIIDEILKRYNYYTLIVPILARQLRASGWSLIELKEELLRGISAFENSEKVVVVKDEKVLRMNGLDIMRSTFRVVKLTEMQKEVLANLYLLRKFVLNKAQYRKYFQSVKDIKEHIDAVNDLILLGWLQEDRDIDNSDCSFYLHPIIEEMVKIELKPSINENIGLKNFIKSYLPFDFLGEQLFDGEEIDELTVLEKDKIVQKLKWFCIFASTFNKDDSKNFEYVVGCLFSLLNGNLFVYDLFVDTYKFKYDFLPKLECYVENNLSIREEVKLQIFLILELHYLSTLRFVRREYREISLVNKYFDLAKILLDGMSNKNNAYIWVFCKPVLQLIEQYHWSEWTKEMRYMYDVLKGYETICSKEFNSVGLDKYRFADGYFEREKLYQEAKDEILDEEKINNEERLLRALMLEKRKQPRDYYLDYYNEFETILVNEFASGVDVKLLNQKIVTNQNLANDDKNGIFYAILWKTCYGLIYPFGDCNAWLQEIKNKDWTRVLDLLEYQEDFYLNNDGLDSDITYRCDVYRVLLNVISGNEDVAKEFIKYLIEEFHMILTTEINCCHWSRFTEFNTLRENILFQNLSLCFDCLHNLNRCDLALDYLIVCVNDVHNSLKSLEEYSEEMMYSWYKTIEEFAREAQIYAADDESFQRFWDIEEEYQIKLDKIMKKDFEEKYDFDEE